MADPSREAATVPDEALAAAREKALEAAQKLRMSCVTGDPCGCSGGMPHGRRAQILAACDAYAAALGSVPAQTDYAFELHRCEVCGAYWRLFRDSWSLWPGQECGKCCDNAPMDHVRLVHDWPPLFEVPSEEEAQQMAQQIADELRQARAPVRRRKSRSREEVERIVRETLDAIEDEPEGWSATAEEVARVIARVHARLGRKGEG